MKNVSLTDILELSVAERIRLAQAIWDSVAAVPESISLSEEDRRELDRRLEAYYQDPQAGSPWPEVKQRLLQGR